MKLSDADFLSYVFDCAIRDRETLADCHHKGDPEIRSILSDVVRMKKLRDKLLPEGRPKNLTEHIRSLVSSGKAREVGLTELKEIHKWNGKTISCRLRKMNNELDSTTYTGCVRGLGDDGITLFVEIPELGIHPSTGDWWVRKTDAVLL